MISHLGLRGNERLPPIASPNHMHPLPRVPNFCGNGFGPWNGMQPEVFALSTKVVLICSSSFIYLIAWHRMLSNSC
jgi:hypothetical protein